MFESHYVCYFFMQWGYMQGLRRVPLEHALLGNMQNDFDAKFGDVCGEAGARFFIIEFKSDRKLFRTEVGTSGKLHRSRLYQHLRHDGRCRDLANLGHFGCYPVEGQSLAFEPYAHCPAPQLSRAELLEAGLATSADSPWNQLNYQDWVIDFQTFYQKVVLSGDEMNAYHTDSFKTGLGLSRPQLEEYVRCMYEHLSYFEDEQGQAVLGALCPASGKVFMFEDSLENLLKRLHRCLAEFRATLHHDHEDPRGTRGPSR
ncbi:hypothetical protein ABE583_15945 [Stenotrophomonas sp. TWI143]|uniref:hypothetical protein n=1 Tax=Stenotrophomonas sp. TWI143 TaxID=3136771 RepID=UPI002988818B|nr:hypothetical protein [Stenotrophomonas maltophilia]HDS1230643.1 hypothetical protein [Stenotrophomonas maltophilia]